jgi:hypothetical protein
MVQFKFEPGWHLPCGCCSQGKPGWVRCAQKAASGVIQLCACPKCGGSGQERVGCGTCNGTGLEPCLKCRGSGRGVLGLLRCEKCGGKGAVECGICDKQGYLPKKCGHCRGLGGNPGCPKCRGSREYTCPACSGERNLSVRDALLMLSRVVNNDFELGASGGNAHPPLRRPCRIVNPERIRILVDGLNERHRLRQPRLFRNDWQVTLDYGGVRLVIHRVSSSGFVILRESSVGRCDQDAVPEMRPVEDAIIPETQRIVEAKEDKWPRYNLGFPFVTRQAQWIIIDNMANDCDVTVGVRENNRTFGVLGRYSNGQDLTVKAGTWSGPVELAPGSYELYFRFSGSDTVYKGERVLLIGGKWQKIALQRGGSGGGYKLRAL